MTTIYGDTAHTLVLHSTRTTGELDIRDAGRYSLGVVDLPASGAVAVEVLLGGSWVEVKRIVATDLRPAGANFSGTSEARLSPGRYRVSVAEGGPTVYVGGAGEG